MLCLKWWPNALCSLPLPTNNSILSWLTLAESILLNMGPFWQSNACLSFKEVGHGIKTVCDFDAWTNMKSRLLSWSFVVEPVFVTPWQIHLLFIYRAQQVETLSKCQLSLSLLHMFSAWVGFFLVYLVTWRTRWFVFYRAIWQVFWCLETCLEKGRHLKKILCRWLDKPSVYDRPSGVTSPNQTNSRRALLAVKSYSRRSRKSFRVLSLPISFFDIYYSVSVEWML